MFTNELKSHDADINVFSLGHVGPFDLNQAQKLIPIISRLTFRHQKNVEDLNRLLEHSLSSVERRIIETKMSECYQLWAQQIRKLGAEPKGPWLVDFDKGDYQYWCWRYPEKNISFYHSHDSGFSGRKPIDLPVKNETH